MAVLEDPAPSVGTARVTAAPPRRDRGGIWPLVLRLHFYAGVLVAPFLLVAAVTGLLFTLTPQLDRVLYGDELSVRSVPVQGEAAARPLSEQLSAARAAHPEGTVAYVSTPRTPEDTTRVVLNVAGLRPEEQRTVFVDPYTARVTGELTTWFDATPVTTWLDTLHRNLHLGDAGALYSELAASWLWVVVLGGLAMWLFRGRTYRRGRKRRQVVLPDLAAAKGVRRTRGWHASTGVWLAVGLLFLSATGLTWSDHAGARFTELQEALGATRPALVTALPTSTPDPAGSSGHHEEAVDEPAAMPEVDPAELDAVLATGRAAGMAGPVVVTPPADLASTWSVAQADHVWPMRLSSVAVDAGSGTVTARTSYDEWPLLSKLSSLGVQAHMGVLFGLVNQILLAALAIGLICVIVWGYRMWWQRRPTRADRRAPVGTPPARGTWRQLSTPVLVGIVAVTLLLCWALPLLGFSLAAFLITDAYAEEFGKQRAAACSR